jgi:hypothetical protein
LSRRTPEEILALFGYGEDIARVPFPAETRDGVKAIFTDAFMREYTNCNSFDEFMFSSAVFVNWDDDLLVYSKSRFDAFVSEVSSFRTWDAMLKKAGESYGTE